MKEDHYLVQIHRAFWILAVQVEVEQRSDHGEISSSISCPGGDDSDSGVDSLDIGAGISVKFRIFWRLCAVNASAGGSSKSVFLRRWDHANWRNTSFQNPRFCAWLVNLYPTKQSVVERVFILPSRLHLFFGTFPWTMHPKGFINLRSWIVSDFWYQSS